MLNVLLQVIGGVCYLLNKIFLMFSEQKKEHKPLARRWRISAWAVYLIGLPAWVILFIFERNWIAALLETSGAPGMFLGLIIAYKGSDSKPPRWLDWLAIIAIPVGLTISLIDYGGLNTINQWLEIGLVLGFLVGTYRLAKHKADGYIWFIVMNICCASLMYVQGYYLLMAQQVVSMGFTGYAYTIAKK